MQTEAIQLRESIAMLTRQLTEREQQKISIYYEVTFPNNFLSVDQLQ